MKREDILRILKDTLKKEGIRKAYIFGSFARKEKKYKDIDVIIKPPKKFSLLDLVHVQNILKKKIGKKMDILTFSSISRHVQPYIEKDLVQIL